MTDGELRDPNISSSPLRLLILEDNPGDAELIARELEKSFGKVRVEVIDSVEHFRSSLEASDYDLILSDYNLRGWTACEALDMLKDLARNIPLIVITGSLGKKRPPNASNGEPPILSSRTAWSGFPPRCRRRWNKSGCIPKRSVPRTLFKRKDTCSSP